MCGHHSYSMRVLQCRLGQAPHLRAGQKCCASSSSLHSGHQASRFQSRMATMATRMLPKVMRQPAMMGEAMRQVKSILCMPAWSHW